eukprot:TRINITY_DN2784_c0_g1_i1.p1 TRINITY_DN2784_c0_g1~~TRINITY_DN2784_c0_g1_i1.p1  ORF type:complete len:487 (-),score=82.11 TRINITY_DN2784_c0_g1_i1:435-1841(-)
MMASVAREPRYFIPPPDSDIELKKATVNHLIDTLDEDGVWKLAAVLYRCGVLQQNYAGVDQASQQGSTRQLFSLAAHVPANNSPPEAFVPAAINKPFIDPAPAAFVPLPSAPRANALAYLGEATAQAAPLQQLVAQMVAQSAPSPIAAPAPASPVATGAPSSEGQTTLILRNVPHQLDQTNGMSWLDEHGYAGLYDFFLWFPPKQSKRLNQFGYALVNFVSKEVATRFMQAYHLTKLFDDEPAEHDGGEEARLNITFANVQGFVQNYERFSPICDEPHTKCAPFFALDSLVKYGFTEPARGKSHANNTQNPSLAATPSADARPPPMQKTSFVDGQTTIVIRNLPPNSVDTQEAARQWLDDFGFGDAYDFLLYLPPKSGRQAGNSTKRSYGYMFVNFLDSAIASACSSKLHGMFTCDLVPKVNVAASRVQGFNECKSHFASLAESDSCKPWIREAAAVKKTSAGLESFQ